MPIRITLAVLTASSLFIAVAYGKPEPLPKAGSCPSGFVDACDSGTPLNTTTVKGSEHCPRGCVRLEATIVGTSTSIAMRSRVLAVTMFSSTLLWAYMSSAQMSEAEKKLAELIDCRQFKRNPDASWTASQMLGWESLLGWTNARSGRFQNWWR